MATREAGGDHAVRYNWHWPDVGLAVGQVWPRHGPSYFDLSAGANRSHAVRQMGRGAGGATRLTRGDTSASRDMMCTAREVTGRHQLIQLK